MLKHLLLVIQFHHTLVLLMMIIQFHIVIKIIITVAFHTIFFIRIIFTITTYFLTVLLLKLMHAFGHALMLMSTCLFWEMLKVNLAIIEATCTIIPIRVIHLVLHTINIFLVTIIILCSHTSTTIQRYPWDIRLREFLNICS